MISIYNGEQTITLMSVEGFLEPSRNFWPAFITQKNYQNLTKKKIFVKIYKLLSNLYVRKSSINQQSRNASAVLPKYLTLKNKSSEKTSFDTHHKTMPNGMTAEHSHSR